MSPTRKRLARTPALAATVAGLCALTSCQQGPTPAEVHQSDRLMEHADRQSARNHALVTEQMRLRAAATAPTARPGEVVHVVLIWLKNPGDPTGRDAVVAASKQLKAIRGVEDVQVGTVLPSTRPVVDSSYDIGLVIRLRDAQALQDYAADPLHVRLADEVLKPSAAKFLIYDFTVR